MRDAFGGVFMIKLFIVFIFIYVGITAVSLNYARAFRVKNKVIDFVEQQEIVNLEDYFGSGITTKDKTKLDNIVTSSGYYKECTSGETIITADGTGYCYKGIVILKNREEDIAGTNSKVIYYQIKTYADWNLGILNKILALAGQSESSDSVLIGSWQVSGEAKVVLKN